MCSFAQYHIINIAVKKDLCCICLECVVNCWLQWAPTVDCADQLYANTNASQTQPAEYGKTELSLMHFTVCVLLGFAFPLCYSQIKIV